MLTMVCQSSELYMGRLLKAILEKHQLEEANQSFRGGGGLCMLYRYHTSPVGPYNEVYMCNLFVI